MKNGNPTTLDSPRGPKAYLLAARPKTWIASISPVCIGTAMAPHISIPILALTLLFALLIQIGTNFANDYFDFINGADSPLRNGPQRAVQEGWIAPRSMRLAAFLVFGSALFTAIPLMLLAGLWSLFLAAACIAFGILYTGGPKPLGYLGLGELLVLIFFGPIAACGAYFLQTGLVALPVFIASLAPGLLSCSILIANNLRDEASDLAAHKKTLVVRWGAAFGKWEYILSSGLAACVPVLLVFFYHAPPKLLAASLIVPPSWRALRSPALLQISALLLFVYTSIFCLTLRGF